MSRLFDGVDDEVQWAVGGCNLTGAYTFAAVIKLDAGVSWQSYIGNETSGTGSEIALGRHSNSNVYLPIGGGASGTNAVTHSSADGWVLVAGSRPAGAGQTITLHKYPIGGSPTHTAGAGTFGNALTQAGGKIVFGQIDGADFFKGRLAVCAEFATALSNVDIESLVTTLTRANWIAKGAVGLWDELDVFQTDYGVGTATRTSLVGTADDADDPAGWASWAGSGPSAVVVGASAGMFGRELVDKAGW